VALLGAARRAQIAQPRPSGGESGERSRCRGRAPRPID